MIKIVAKNYIKSDKVDEFTSLAKKLVQETVQKDAGCIRYELFQDMSDPQILTFIEEWENKESLDQHMSAKHFKEIVPLLMAFAEKPGEMNIYRKLI